MRVAFFCLLLGCSLVAAGLLYQAYPINLPSFSFNTGEKAAEGKQLVFTGDVFLGRAVERWYRQTGQNPFAALQPWLAEYQHVLVNFESAIPQRHVPTPDYTFRFSVATSALPLVSASHVTHASLANNHSYDFGAAGWQHSRRALRQAGIEAIGHPYTVATSAVSYLPTSVGAVAVVAINTVGTPVAREEIAALLQQVTAEAEHTIVFIHWGEEYQATPSEAQQELAAAMALPGVRAIIGHHPHVLQPVARINKTLVFYSLGNTVFDQYFSPAVQNGLLVTVEARATRLGFGLYPISSQQSRHTPSLLTETARQEALAELAARSAVKLQTDIKNGFIPLP